MLVINLLTPFARTPLNSCPACLENSELQSFYYARNAELSERVRNAAFG
jgi:hypothetical protein